MKERPVFILVEPQLGENIGMSARTMCNFGFLRLRIVAPRSGEINAVAHAASAGAMDYMQIEVFQTLPDAVADLHTLFATTARDRANKTVETFTKDALSLPSVRHETTGILFGPERRGLTNEQIACCTHCFKIPVDEQFPSINLAQSVGIIAYELSSLWRTHRYCEKQDKSECTKQAKKESVFALSDFVVDHLKHSDYFTKENQQRKTLRIRSIFHNANFRDSDIKLLFGIFRHLSTQK